MDSYFTLQSNIEASGEFVDRKSRFIAQLVHIESEDEANAFIEMVRKRHYDARHNVPAWILVDGRERQSDDGEPSRTSGMPTLEVLRGAGLKNVCCVVTRYFGGTLLGPGGLVRAYTAATQAAVASAQESGQIVEMTSVVPVVVHVAYPQYEQVLRLAQDSGAKVSDTDYADTVTLHLVFKAAAERTLIRSNALERAADGRRVLLAKTLGDFARQFVGLTLGLGVFHAVAHHEAHDGHGARDGAAGFGHAAHAGAKALGEGKGDLGVEPDGGRERAGDGLGAVKATGVVFGSLSLTGGDVELGRIDLLHRCLLGHGVPAYGTRDGACNHRELHVCLIFIYRANAQGLR